MAEFPQNLEAENPLLAGLYAPDDSPQALRPSRVNVRVLSPVNVSESRARSRVFPIVDAATDADLPVEALEFGGVECRLYQMRTSTVATRTLAQKLCYPYVLVTRDAHDWVSLSSFVFDEYRPEHPIDWKRRAWLMVPVFGTLLIVVIAVLQMRGAWSRAFYSGVVS